MEGNQRRYQSAGGPATTGGAVPERLPWPAAAFGILGGATTLWAAFVTLLSLLPA